MDSLDRNRLRVMAVLGYSLMLLLGAACDEDEAAMGTSADMGQRAGNGGDRERESEDTEEAADRYYVGAASMALGAATNEADCALCHSVDGSQEGLSGKSFKDIAYKESWKGGDASTLLDASNACVTGWMGGEALADDDEEWKSLEAYLKSISDEDASEANVIMPEVLADEAAYEDAYAGGDAEAGEAKYDLYCGACHSEQLTVGVAPAWAFEAIAARSIGRIAQKVRTAGPPPSGSEEDSDTTGGPMPFFEPSDLSADDLSDIIAYIKRDS
ncbi:MAG: c-type cytochrome [Myxococcales bacterium]|nr:c-type cytochrome [Myxococcales bacterium]